MPLLPSILAGSSRAQSQQPFILAQSSAAASCLPILRSLVGQSRGTVLLFCLFYSPTIFTSAGVVSALGEKKPNVKIFDWTDDVPGYTEDGTDHREDVLRAVKEVPENETLTVVIDSVDTLLSDLSSLSKTQIFLSTLYSSIRSRTGSSRLVLHLLAPSQLLSILTQTRFSNTLTHLTAHAPPLLTHLSTAYLTPPPPLSTPEKFYSIFLPLSERQYDVDKLVYGPDCEGSTGAEIVISILVRGGAGTGMGSEGRRRGVERTLEGWKISNGSGSSCELNELEGLKSVFSGKKVIGEVTAPDPTQNLSFNLNLTTEQQQSRAQVPLPYAHDNKPEVAQQNGAILYDPDSADDIDDDDPDEDLDI